MTAPGERTGAVIEHRVREVMSADDLAATSEGFCGRCRAQLEATPEGETHVVSMNLSRYEVTIGTCPDCGRQYVLTWRRSR